MKNTKVISGFPGVGKSVLTSNSNFIVLDSDSSSFSWSEKGIRHPDFPANYMAHIQENMGAFDYILVSSHDIAREALKESGIEYTLVYPDMELKEEYVERYKARGNNEGFVTFISENWPSFISNIEKETFPTLVKLNSNQYLSDVLSEI